MDKKSFLGEIHGTIAEIYDKEIRNKTTIGFEKRVVITPDEGNITKFDIPLKGEDIKKFKVGQRIVYIEYLINENDIGKLKRKIYDELKYEQSRRGQSAHKEIVNLEQYRRGIDGKKR